MESPWSPHKVLMDSVRTVRSPHGVHGNSWVSVKYSRNGNEHHHHHHSGNGSSRDSTTTAAAAMVVGKPPPQWWQWQGPISIYLLLLAVL